MTFVKTSASLCVTLLSVVLVFTCADQTNISAEPGDDVTLTCKLPNNDPVTVLEWRRADLTGYVLMYRSKQLDPEGQHPSYVNRVDLQMKDGNVSLILKNVTTDDEGRYKCQIFQRRRNHRKRDILKPICVVNLSVDPPAPPGGGKKDGGMREVNSRLHVVLVVGLLVFGVAVILLVTVTVISKRHTKKNSHLPPPDEADLQQTLVL